MKKIRKVNWQKKLFLLIIIFFGILLVPSTVQAATVFFSPSSGSYEVGANFSVGLYVNSDGQAINSAQANVSFPTNLLEVTDLTKDVSFDPYSFTRDVYNQWRLNQIYDDNPPEQIPEDFNPEELN